MFNYKNLKKRYDELGPYITDPEFFEDGIYSVTGEDNDEGKYMFIGTMDSDLQACDGVGLCIYQSGNMYEGFWENNQAKGEGRYIMQNKDYYEGEFDNDRMHGKGIMYCANGEVKEGEWNNDKFIDENYKPEEDEKKVEQKDKQDDQQYEEDKEEIK